MNFGNFFFKFSINFFRISIIIMYKLYVICQIVELPVKLS